MVSNDQPDCFELIQTVNDFLVSIEGKLHGSDRYGLQCTKHVLNIVAREIEQARANYSQSNSNLSQFYKLLAQENGNIEKLCLDIRKGKYDDSWENTLEAVLDHVIEKVKVSDPGHLRNDN